MNEHESIFIVLLLVWALNWHTDVVGLVALQNGQLGSKSIEVQSCDLLVELLGQLEHSGFKLLGGSVGPELELGECLVAERGGHDEGRVASGATEVEETA